MHCVVGPPVASASWRFAGLGGWRPRPQRRRRDWWGALWGHTGASRAPPRTGVGRTASPFCCQTAGRWPLESSAAPQAPSAKRRRTRTWLRRSDPSVLLSRTHASSTSRGRTACARLAKSKRKQRAAEHMQTHRRCTVSARWRCRQTNGRGGPNAASYWQHPPAALHLLWEARPCMAAPVLTAGAQPHRQIRNHVDELVVLLGQR